MAQAPFFTLGNPKMSAIKLVTGEDRPVFARFVGGPLAGQSLEIMGAAPQRVFARAMTEITAHALEPHQAVEDIESSPPLTLNIPAVFNYQLDESGVKPKYIESV